MEVPAGATPATHYPVNLNLHHIIWEPNQEEAQEVPTFEEEEVEKPKTPLLKQPHLTLKLMSPQRRRRAVKSLPILCLHPSCSRVGECC